MGKRVGASPTTSPSGDLIPTIRGSGAHPGRGHVCLLLQYLLQSCSRGAVCVCFVLHPMGHGSANTCSSTCTLSPAGLLQSFRRDPLRDKIREVGRGLSLADTQTGRYVRLYSRRRLCARRGADARRSFGSCSSSALRQFGQNPILLISESSIPIPVPGQYRLSRCLE